MSDEISFEALTGSGKADSTEVSFEDVTGVKPVQPAERIVKANSSIAKDMQNIVALYGSSEDNPVSNWLTTAANRLISSTGEAVKTAATSSPEQTSQGVGEAILSVGSSMLAPVIAKTRRLLGNEESYGELKKKATLEPETEAGGNYTDLISSLPPMQAIGKATEEAGRVTEYFTNKAIPAEQATDAFNTALIFAGTLDTAMKKAQAKSPSAPVSEAVHGTVFDEMAAKDPKGAAEFADHVEAVDKELGQELKKKAAKQKGASAKQQQEIGKKQVEAEAAGEVSFEELAKSDEVSYEDLIKQASGEETPVAKSPVENNASGESSASLEAISRVAEENSAGRFRYKLMEDGTIVPLSGVDAVDVTAKQGQMIVRRVGDEAYEVVDRGGHSKESATRQIRLSMQQLEQLSSQKLAENHTRIGDGMRDAVQDGYNTLRAVPEQVGKRSKILEAVKDAPEKGLGLVKTKEGEWTLVKDREPLQAYTDPVAAVQDFKAAQQQEQIAIAAFLGPEDLRKLPGARIVEGKVKEYVDQAIRTFSPESLGPEAKKAGAIVAKNMSEQMQADSSYFHRGQLRRKFWNKLGEQKSTEFIKDYEKGNFSQTSLPPILPGSIRFYHGGTEYKGGSRFLTEDRAYAEGYAAKSGNAGKVMYVDIPETSAELAKINKSYDDTGTGYRAPYVHWDAPANIASKLKEIPSKVVHDPLLDAAAKGYQDWNQRIVEQDARLSGISYEPLDNYLFHLFKDQDGVTAFFNQRYGSKWGNPKFIKDRTFDLYAEAVAAGFEPKFKNPEDIMLARQHASDVAQMRVQTLREMEANGLAVRITEKNAERPKDFPASEWRAPNGERYWVHDSAGAILDNVFNTQSLWNMKGIVGDTFRGAMYLKNILVPIKLALSLFHPLHVLTIDNATGMVRASKELLSGESSPFRWMADMAKATAYKGIIDSPIQGNRLLNVWKGKVADADLTAVDRTSLQYMTEGGFIPELSSQYRTKAYEGFMEALQQRKLSTPFKLPLAALALLNKPIFEIWIPSLKIASYLKDVQTALKTDPSLASDSMARQLAFRKISKSVDNRYGEMAYGTLFWNRWVKDLAVANTLSLGWQMGFLREYGGGMMDLGQVVTSKGSVVEKASRGQLDRPLFVTFYTAQALAYAGLMTWAMTGKPPDQLLDYTHPRTGEQNPDGSDERLNTMFYPREFVSIYKHMENEGVVAGLGHLAASKSSGLIGQVTEWSTGVNSFGKEIRDPDAPAFKQLEQTLAATLIDLEPISIGAVGKGQNPALAFAGFGTAPKYITESKTSGAIRNMYQKYYSQKQTPFDRAQYSGDTEKLKQYYQGGDSEKFSDLVEKMRDKYDLTGMDTRRLEKSVAKNDDPNLTMFNHFTWQQQKKLLDGMSETEREVYLPKANREHLRYNYQPPESP